MARRKLLEDGLEQTDGHLLAARGAVGWRHCRCGGKGATARDGESGFYAVCKKGEKLRLKMVFCLKTLVLLWHRGGRRRLELLTGDGHVETVVLMSRVDGK